MTGEAPGGSAAHPLARTFLHDRDRVFLEEDRGAWSVGRLLSLAADVARSLPRGPAPSVAVRSRSAAFIVGSLLALWKEERCPLLLDPALRDERDTLARLDPGVPVLVPHGGPPDDRDIVVRETGGAPIGPVLPAPAAVSVAFFTSGSTGEPKIVEKRDAQMVAQFEVEPAWLGLDPPVATVSLVPAHHILGYIYGFHMPAATGGRVVFASGSAPQAWIDTIRRVRPSLVVGVPLHFRLIAQRLDAPLPRALYLSSGGPLPGDVGARFRERAGWPVTEVYGSTEAGGIATRTGDEPWRPLPGLEWQVRAADGRLLVRSPWQAVPGAWQCQDDVVEPAGAGFTLLGRADSIVKVGGRRFSLAEIVQAAAGCEGVDQAHAIVYDRYGEQAVGLFVVPRPGGGLTAVGLRASLASRLAAFKVPRTIRLLAELPLRGIGKVDEGALRSLVTVPEP